MFRYLRQPGLPIDEQLELNRYELEQKPFEELEREIRTELEYVLGPWGFDAAKDIKAITVNRWGHGYIVFPHPDAHSPHRLRGRERIGRISFAGVDARRYARGASRRARTTSVVSSAQRLVRARRGGGVGCGTFVSRSTKMRSIG